MTNKTTKNQIASLRKQVSNLNIKNSNKKKTNKNKKNGVNSNNQVINGRGKYTTSSRSIIGRGGAYLGGLAGDALSSWFGFGKYELNKNTLYKGVMSGGPYPMHSAGEEFRVRKREFLFDVLSSGTAGAFQLSTVALNPGLSSSFPWLSSIAQAFQEYEWEGLIFEFKSASADAIASSVNTTLGTVMMATQYRSDQPSPGTKVDLLDIMWSSDCKPSCNFIEAVECDPRENPNAIQYVRTGAVPAGSDIKTYDIGELFVATNGFQGTNVNAGELWVSYDVVFRKPASSAPAGTTIPVARYDFNSAITLTSMFGTTGETKTARYDNIGLNFATNTITFPPGREGIYLVTIELNGTVGVANDGWTAVVLVNATALNLFNNGNSRGYAGASIVDAPTVMGQFTSIQLNGGTPQATFTTSLINPPTGASCLTVIISQLNQNMFP